MGEHGKSQFPAWSTVRVNNEPITDYAQVDYDQLADAARAGGWKIYQAKHYTSYGIATIATEMTQAIISDAKRIFRALTMILNSVSPSVIRRRLASSVLLTRLS